ncbi:helix-turn-helix transcriptional regulator [Alloiococcus sp. CFN-8]|uniref:helix-turn-helix transcriptional regulator n=1 Tax=Alloiococcus sp. CFN-8 TaxID=3416081 RepID=UPI003CEFC875
MNLSSRQEKIIDMVKEAQPITSEALASNLGVTRAALRPDLAILTMTGILEARPKVGYIYTNKPYGGFVYDYIMKTTADSVMSKPVSVEENTMVYDAILNLFLHDVGSLTVESNGFLIGKVSRKDFLKITMGSADLHKVPVGVIMTRMPNLITAEPKENIYEVAKKIIHHEIDSVPVVKKEIHNGREQLKILGKVSKTNITKLFLKLCELK